MATREENLKKINVELEKLSDDELEKIAGGIEPPWWWPDNPFEKANATTQQQQGNVQFSDRSGNENY